MDVSRDYSVREGVGQGNPPVGNPGAVSDGTHGGPKRLTERRAGKSWFGVAENVKMERSKAGITLMELHLLTEEVDPNGKGLSAAQINRIENGKADATVFDLWLLTQALKISVTKLMAEEPPYLLARKSDAEKLLAEFDPAAAVGKRSKHAKMIELGHYKYAPLQFANVRSVRPEGEWMSPRWVEEGRRFVMQKYLFRVEGAVASSLPEVFDSHEGEELVVVLKGRLELLLGRGSNAVAIELLPGDVMQYSSAREHLFRALPDTDGRSVAEAVFVYTWRGDPGGDTPVGPVDH
jgi:transcriptional regulator with XRE-family HTH domain